MFKASIKNSMFWYLKNYINQYEVGVSFWELIFSHSKSLFVNNNHNIVIEGYPRSGNTYCVALVQSAAGSDIDIARHRHEVGQLKRALRFGISTIVVIREPLNSIASFMIREKVSFRLACKYYIDYYMFLCARGSDILIIEFSELIKCQDQVLEKISEFAQLNFKFRSLNDLDQMAKSRVSEMEKADSGGVVRYTHVAAPSEERAVIKQELIDMICSKYSFELSEAQEVYSRVLGKSLDNRPVPG